MVVSMSVERHNKKEQLKLYVTMCFSHFLHQKKRRTTFFSPAQNCKNIFMVHRKLLLIENSTENVLVLIWKQRIKQCYKIVPHVE